MRTLQTSLRRPSRPLSVRAQAAWSLEWTLYSALFPRNWPPSRRATACLPSTLLMLLLGREDLSVTARIRTNPTDWWAIMPGAFSRAKSLLTWPSAKAVDENSGRKVSVRHRRQGFSNALREIGRAIGRLRGLVNQRATPQLVKWQRCIDPARIIEVAIDQAVEQMPDVEAAGPAGGIRVTHDVDGAAIGQQVIVLRPIGEFVDPRQINQQQPAGIVRRRGETIEAQRLV